MSGRSAREGEDEHDTNGQPLGGLENKSRQLQVHGSTCATRWDPNDASAQQEAQNEEGEHDELHVDRDLFGTSFLRWIGLEERNTNDDGTDDHEAAHDHGPDLEGVVRRQDEDHVEQLGEKTTKDRSQGRTVENDPRRLGKTIFMTL